MDPELRVILERFEGYFERIQENFVQIDGRFGQMEDRFAQIDGRFAQIDGRFAQIDGRFAQIDGELAGLKDGNLLLRAEMQSLRFEMNERFVSVDEQMRTLTLRVVHFEAGTQRDLAGLKKDVGQLGDRMKNVETGMVGLHGRIDTLADEMRQRFRGVNERLRV